MKPVVMTLGDVCTKGSSNLAQKDLDGNSGEYEIYGASGLIKKVNFFHQEKPYISVVKDGAGVGRTMLLPARTSVIGTMQYIIPNENIDIEYLYYAITYMDLSRYYMGAAIPHIYFKDYCKEKILVPDIDIQKAIAHKFRIIDGLITARQEQLAKLGELIASRFIEMFGRIQDNKKGYSIVTIGDVCSLIKDGTHQTPEYTEDVKNGYKFLSSKDVMSQKIDWSNIKYISASLHERLYSSLKPQRNDILMSKNGVNYGVAAINDSDEIFDIYVSLALLRPSKSIHPVYLRCVINSADTKNQFDSSIKGIGVPNLHLGEIKNTKILLPPIDLQNQFAEFVKQTDKSKYLATLYIKLLKNERMMFCDQL